MLGIEQWLYYGIFAFSATLAVYNGQRIYKSGVLQRTPWLRWVYNNRTYLIALVVLALLSAVYFLVQIINWTLPTILLLALSSGISMFYIVRVRGKNLREMPYIKIHLIAFSWTAMLIMFPLINETITNNQIIYIVAHYFYVVGVTIPFDIRDLKYDQPMQRTIPQILGINGARILGAFLVVAFSILMLYANVSLWTNPLFYIAIAVQLALIIGMNENQSDVYCAGGIDGAISLLGLAYLFA